MLALNDAVNCMKLQGHKFHFKLLFFLNKPSEGVNVA